MEIVLVMSTIALLIMITISNQEIVKLQNKISSLESRLKRMDQNTDYTAIDKRKEKMGL